MTDLSDLTTLTNLTSLDVNDNQLASLSGLKALMRLTRLNVSSNPLTNLSGLTELTRLTTLHVSGNKLTELSYLKDLTRLTNLYVSDNMLTDISVLGELANLAQLDLDHNQLTDISVLGKMDNLTWLDLSRNQLTDISVLGKLDNLTQLELRGNQLTDISVLGKLENLTWLDLRGNQLTDISGLRELRKLTRLHLNNNEIKEFPEWITELGMEIYYSEGRHEKGINLGKNPLETPPVEIVKQGREAIRDWFAAQKKGKGQTLNEAKVLLVGDGGSGKTSIRKRLMGETYNPEEPQTHGIRIEDWLFEHTGQQIKAHVWDFGGQDIMHATHQFFFTRRSLYVLLLNAREEPNPEDWLKLIESFGGDSPILVVINKIDENQGFDINRKFLREKYKNIQGIYRISCDTEEGIEEFRDSLQEELANVEMIRQVWTQDWLKVKHDLEGLPENYIKYKEYHRICTKHGIKKKSAQNTLLNYLHELGVVLHFEELGLKDVQVLEPKWVTEAVYKIINSRTLANSKGMLRKDSLENILNKERFTDDAPLSMERTIYTATECGYILELMKKFELCYELGNEQALVSEVL
ncbi:MAG: leucine-rich repeat domain-containing protein [Planctomycetes bacterium]|nr:leucine-rich repeat domain-containing protein [Planctomycetota bacterium]